MSDKPQAILLLDDDPDFLTISRSVLESAGYRVVCAADVEEAWERLAEEKPRLVVADLMMKTLDAGFAFARRLKADERYRDIPLIILTGIAGQRGYDFTPRAPEDLKSMGADAYIEKPATGGALLAKVRELLAGGEA